MSEANPENHFVEIRYHDQIVDEQAKAEKLATSGCFVHCENPMPVGSRLTMKVRAKADPTSKAVGPYLVATVKHVEEASSRAKTTLSGMKLAIEETDEKAKEFLEQVVSGTSPAEAAGEDFEEEPVPDAYESVASQAPEPTEETPETEEPEKEDQETEQVKKPEESQEPEEGQKTEEETPSQQPSEEDQQAPPEDSASASGEIVSGEIGGGFDGSTMEITADIPPETEEVEQRSFEEIEKEEDKKKKTKKKKKEDKDDKKDDENDENDDTKNGKKKKRRRGRRSRKKKKS